MRLHMELKFIAVLKGRLNMARLIEVYMEENLTIIKTSEGYPFKDLVYGIGHAECVVALDASGNFFGVGEKGLLMILCDMQFPPHLLFENTFDSDAIQLV